MRNAVVKLSAAVLLFTPRPGGAEQPTGKTAAPPSPEAAVADDAWQNDPMARAFYQYGVRCGRGPGPDGLDLRQALPAIAAHAAESPMVGDLTPYETPVGRTLLLLDMFGIAYSETLDAQQARTRFPQVAEAYRLYYLLEGASPAQQHIDVRAFREGFSLGLEKARQAEALKAAQALQQERLRLQQRYAASPAWQRDPEARRFFAEGAALGSETGADGLPLYNDDPPLPPTIWEDKTRILTDVWAAGLTGKAPGQMTALREALLFLSLEGRADSKLPTDRQARSKDPRVAESYQLYQRLKSAPPGRQEMYVAAFETGCARGWAKGKRQYDRQKQEEERQFASHRRLTRELLTHTPDEDLEQAVVDYVLNKIGDHWDQEYQIVSGLPKPIQQVYAMRIMRADIDGDGFQEFSRWELAHVAVAGYRLVGAVKHSALVERAIEIVPKEKQKEDEQPDSDSPETDERHTVLDTLDDEFYALDKSEAVEPLIARYIRARPDQFVAD